MEDNQELANSDKFALKQASSPKVLKLLHLVGSRTAIAFWVLAPIRLVTGILYNPLDQSARLTELASKINFPGASADTTWSMGTRRAVEWTNALEGCGWTVFLGLLCYLIGYAAAEYEHQTSRTGDKSKSR